MEAQSNLLAQGESLALNRRRALKELIKTDPRQALASAVSIQTRQQLPASIGRHLEDRVNGKGSLTVWVADDFDRGTCEVHREARIGGKTYQAFVYGRRLRDKSRSNVPLHGIAIDDVLAVAEDPVRLLEPGEAFLPRTGGEVCPVCRKPVTVGETVVYAEVGSQIQAFCSPAHLEAFKSQGAIYGDGGGGTGTNAPVEASSWTQGSKSLLLMRVAFPDDPAEPITEDGAYAMMDQVNQFYVENSYDTTAMIADVTPLLILPQTKDAYGFRGRATLQADAREAAREAGMDTDNYDLDIVLFNRVPGPNFDGWNGLAYIGGKGLWMQQTTSAGVAAHELGHNYGLYHANSWSASGDSVIGPGSNSEYGNPFDTMGSPNRGGVYHFNAEFKNELDWLPLSFVQPVTNSGLFRLYAFDLPQLVSGHKYALRIRKDYDRDYWAEFRQKLTSNRWLPNGVLLNWNAWDNNVANSAGGTDLLDTTPGTPTGNSGKDDSAVVIGRTFSDLSAGIHITPVANGSDGSDNWIDVQVNLGSFPGNSAPTLQIAADQTSVPTNTPVAFNATASDLDGDTLAYYWDFGDLTFGSNCPSASKSWSASGVYVVRCTVSDMKGGLASRNVAIIVASPGTFQVGGRVTTSGGQPLDGARMHNGLTGSSYRGAYTDSDGLYVLANLPAGSYTLSAIKYGSALAAAGWSNPVTVGPDSSGRDWTATANPVVGVTASDPWAAEPGSDTGTFTLSRAGSLASALTVTFNLSGTANYPADYALSPTPTAGSTFRYTMPAGIASTNIVLVPANDTLVEGTETATLTLCEDSAYMLGLLAEATVTIADRQAPVLPTVTASAPDDSAPETGADGGVFLFARSGNIAGDLTIHYSVSGTASNGVDYTPLSGLAIMPAGQINVLVSFNAIDDAEVEGDETVLVTILPVAAYQVGASASATVTIVDDDPPRVFITATDNQAWENSSSDRGTFTVTRIGSLAANLVVNYAVGGTASNGADYTALSGTVTIPAGKAAATITVTPINDSLVEGEETAVATLLGNPGYNIVNPGAATVTIIDDDIPGITVAVSSPTASEAGTNTGAFTFARTGSTNDPLTVDFAVFGTAINGVDYAFVSNSLVIPAGTNNAILTISALADSIREANETVVLTLQESPAYSRKTTTPQTVTIIDNNSGGLPGVGFDSSAASGLESVTVVTVLASLSAPSASTVTVGYSVTGGTATGNWVDYYLPSGTFTFAAGQTNQSFTLFVLQDSLVESNETIRLSLSNPVNALLDAITNYTYTIIDDDTTNDVTITAVVSNASETGPQSGTFRISRSGATNSDLTVLFQVTGTASSPSDYPSLGSSCTISAGQRTVDLIVTPVDDPTPERNETVTVELLSASGARIGSPNSATVTIADNDSTDSLPIVSVVAADPIAAEPGSDTGQFVISRDRGTNAPLAVAFTVGGTATTGVDYNSLGTSATIPAGAWSVPLTVVPRDDAIYEGGETVILTLTIQGTNRVSPQASSATVTIMDDEAGVSVVGVGATSEDGSSIGAFLISRVGYLESNLTVNLAVSGTASNGVDYVSIPSSVTLAAGTTMVRVEVLPLDDLRVEGAETVQLTLLSGTGYTVLSPSNAVVFILDNDTNTPPTITLHPVNQLVTEGSNGTFAVTATGTPPLFYQWFFDATNAVMDGTNSLLVLPNVQDVNAGLYSVMISNAVGSVTSSNAGLLVNHRPVPSAPRLERFPGASVKVCAAALLGSDPDGDNLFLSSVSPVSAQGAAVTTNQSWVVYLPPAGLTNDDSFDYTVGDGRGGFGTGTVTIVLVTNTAPSLNLTWTDEGDGSVRLTGDGIPGRRYIIEFTESSEDPNWQPLATVVADEFGGFVSVDRPPGGAGSRFYRATAP